MIACAAPVPSPRTPAQSDLSDAALLRAIIEERRRFTTDEAALVARRVDSFIDRHAARWGRGGITEICARVWQNRDNPARRRDDLRGTKKPTKLLDYVERIARATGTSADDMLLEAFRDTSLTREMAMRQRRQTTLQERHSA